MQKRARRHFTVAAFMFALFAAVVLATTREWTWTVAANVAAVGAVLFLFAGLAWLTLQMASKYRRPES